jgi:hypothetical protein
MITKNELKCVAKRGKWSAVANLALLLIEAKLDWTSYHMNMPR